MGSDHRNRDSGSFITSPDADRKEAPPPFAACAGKTARGGREEIWAGVGQERNAAASVAMAAEATFLTAALAVGGVL